MRSTDGAFYFVSEVEGAEAHMTFAYRSKWAVRQGFFKRLIIADIAIAPTAGQCACLFMRYRRRVGCPLRLRQTRREKTDYPFSRFDEPASPATSVPLCKNLGAPFSPSCGVALNTSPVWNQHRWRSDSRDLYTHVHRWFVDLQPLGQSGLLRRTV